MQLSGVKIFRAGFSYRSQLRKITCSALTSNNLSQLAIFPELDEANQCEIKGELSKSILIFTRVHEILLKATGTSSFLSSIAALK